MAAPTRIGEWSANLEQKPNLSLVTCFGVVEARVNFPGRTRELVEDALNADLAHGHAARMQKHLHGRRRPVGLRHGGCRTEILEQRRS